MRLRVALVAAVALSDCLDPTEIVVVVSTDVPCAQVNSTAIAAGRPGDDTTLTRGKTSACSSDGGIGTLVLTPSQDISDDVGIRVTLGLGSTQADQCVAPKFEGCIVARRALAYYPHHPLTLPITMQQICENQFCDPSSTCVNGSCVDAGIPACDQTGTCTIDAGTPDAGSCTDVAPTLVTPLAVQVTPHVVQTKTGYAVSWETAPTADSTRAYKVALLDTNGNAGTVLDLATSLLVGTAVGPLGTDGTNIAATFVTSSTSYTLREIDPTNTTLFETNGQGPAQLGRAGMHYEASGAYGVFDIGPNGPTFDYWPLSFAQSVSSSTTPIGTNDAALAWFNGTYYGSYHDTSACYLAHGKISSSGASFAVSTWPLCTTVRVAENLPGVDLLVTRESTSTNPASYNLAARASFAPSTIFLTTLDSVDDQAIVALPGVGNQFHVVYGTAQSIRDVIVDTSLAHGAPSTVASATGFTTTFGSIGFDAIAEPSSMIHDVAFWASTPAPGIYFTRICR